MKKQKRCMALAAALTMSLAISSTALAAIPSDIGGHWAQGTIIQWTSKGYISGYEDGTFKPDNSITRAEFVRLVNQSMGYTKTGNAYFSDVSSSYWGYNDIQKGVAAGYVRGDGNGKFRPNDPVSRQEAAVMISQICGLGQDFSAAAKYTDYRYIPSWAAGYVGAVSKAGIMSGYPDGDFKGDRYLSRAEAVIALDKALNYNASTTDNREVLKNYKLTDTSLKDKIIQGDLVISSSLSKKDVVLDNVKVEGSIIVEGGKTITAKNCEINNLEMSTSDATFDATGKTTVKKTTFEKYGKLTGSGYSKVVIDEDLNDYVTLDAEIDEVELDEETNVKLLSDCVIDSFTATKNADNATINFNSAKVKNMYLYDAVRITGKGDIRNMTVYESGVKSSIKPDDLSTKNGASKPTYTENSSGDITWGGGSSKYDDLKASKDGKTYRGGKYDDVKVTGDDVTLDDMTIYGDLTIDDDVREGSVDLEELTIKGNVYIEGGGENSVTFDDCEISGNIYVRKSYGNYPVAVEFDKYTASHIDGKVVISENGAIIKESKNESGAIIDNIEVKTADKVVIGTDVKNLDVMTNTSNLTINSGSDITKLTVSTNAKDSTFTVKGKVKELYTNVDITVNVSGTVEKTSGSGTVNGISVTGVRLDKTSANMTVGETTTLKATVEPATATNKSVTWESSNTAVATVDQSGKVTAVGVGDATITVTAEGNHTATCAVTVTNNEQNIPVSGVSIVGNPEVNEGATTQLTATVTPSSATNKKVTWASSNTEVATVNSDGLVRGVKEGTATITVTTEDESKTASCIVTVKSTRTKVDGVSISGNTNIKENETTKLRATVTPSSATNKTVRWESSNTEVATVNSDGLVRGVKEGTATITVTTEDESKTASCTVTVKSTRTEVDGVSISGNTNIKENEKTQLKATVTPSSATNKNVTWESSNTAVATVDSNGLVTGVKEGTATITVTTEDGGKTATCTVNVSESLESAKAELTALLNQYAVKEDQSTLTATGYKLVIPTVYTAEDFNNVAVGKMYVEASKVTALNAAIDEAYRVLNTSSNVTEVRNEITNFKNTVNGINGAPGLVGVKPTVTLL
ncbi:MAG: Ig-like domain-containing protein [Eubacteriales bacterium]|nr:Ig-like domain-containing protein [Eubacteriales bacterium]